MYLSRGQLASAAVMLASLDVVFLRDVLAARIPDVIAPTAVVAAATVAHVLPPTAVKRGAAIVAVVAVLGAAIPMATRVTLPRPADAVRRIGDVTQRLRRVSPDIIPTPSLAPLIGYLTHCTATRRSDPGDGIRSGDSGSRASAVCRSPADVDSRLLRGPCGCRSRAGAAAA
jgi:hypothetical protein